MARLAASVASFRPPCAAAHTGREGGFTVPREARNMPNTRAEQVVSVTFIGLSASSTVRLWQRRYILVGSVATPTPNPCTLCTARSGTTVSQCGAIGLDVTLAAAAKTLLGVGCRAVSADVTLATAVVALLGLRGARGRTGRRLMTCLEAVETSTLCERAVVSQVSHC